jgi:3',5'-cyclic AMP phosphodiesterase CpdA
MAMKDRYERYLADRERYFQEVRGLDRRRFLEAAGLAAAGVWATGKLAPHSFQPVDVVHAAAPEKSFTFAYVSDTHLYEKKLNERFIRAILRAVEDVNALSPQPDFVLFGGDLAQLGQPGELAEGAQILKAIKAPVKMMVGEHDWYLDMGAGWRKSFGKDVYSFDHKGVHFVVLNSVIVEDYWTGPKLSPMERMLAMAQLDNPNGRPFTVGAEQRDWLAKDLAAVKKDTPLIVFSHSPLYKIYKPWNFWTDDAEEVQKLLAPFTNATVIHGHTHQMLSNRIGNIHFHGMLSTAWPWPYAPQGLPKLTVRMNRADPFDEADGCGNGKVDVLSAGHVDKGYNFWSRNPVRVSSAYLGSDGAADAPARETDVNY